MAAGSEPLLPAEEGASRVDGLASAKRKLLIATLLCTLFMFAEIVGGLLAHSLAVMTDAAHMLSDVAGCALTSLTLKQAQWQCMLSHECCVCVVQLYC